MTTLLEIIDHLNEVDVSDRFNQTFPIWVEPGTAPGSQINIALPPACRSRG